MQRTSLFSWLIVPRSIDGLLVLYAKFLGKLYTVHGRAIHPHAICRQASCYMDGSQSCIAKGGARATHNAPVAPTLTKHWIIFSAAKMLHMQRHACRLCTNYRIKAIENRYLCSSCSSLWDTLLRQWASGLHLGMHCSGCLQVSG